MSRAKTPDLLEGEPTNTPEGAEASAGATGLELAEPAARDAAEDGAGAAEVQAPAPTEPEAPLEAALAEAAELRDRLLRQAADFANFRKRVGRDQEQAALEGRVSVILRLLPILDNLERALAVDAPPDSLREGVLLIQRELLGALDAEGVGVENPVGEAFDPERHQALAHEPAPGHADGMIVEVFRKGYVLGDRLLRPTLVKVAKGDQASGEEQASEQVH